jgi:hypothetical protein
MSRLFLSRNIENGNGRAGTSRRRATGTAWWCAWVRSRRGRWSPGECKRSMLLLRRRAPHPPATASGFGAHDASITPAIRILGQRGAAPARHRPLRHRPQPQRAGQLPAARQGSVECGRPVALGSAARVPVATRQAAQEIVWAVTGMQCCATRRIYPSDTVDIIVPIRYRRYNSRL